MLEHAGKAEITWKRFDSGADVIAALASNSIQIGYLGSAPLAAAVTRQVPIRVVFIASLIGDAEAMAVRPAIATPQDLLGSASRHLCLDRALQPARRPSPWGLAAGSVKVVNLRPPEIIAAWARGDIDGAYVWDPALGNLKATGHVLARSADVAEWGSPTFDVWVAAMTSPIGTPTSSPTSSRRSDGRTRPIARIRRHGWQAATRWTIWSLDRGERSDVVGILAGSYFPTLDEQASPRFLGHDTAAAIAATAASCTTRSADRNPWPITRLTSTPAL